MRALRICKAVHCSRRSASVCLVAAATAGAAFGSRAGAQAPVEKVAHEELTVRGNALGVSSVYWLGIRADGSIAISPGGNAGGVFVSVDGRVLPSAPPVHGSPIVLLGVLGDTVWGKDPHDDFVTFVGPDQHILRTVTVPTAITLPSGDVVSSGGFFGANALWPVAVRPNGDMIVTGLKIELGTDWPAPAFGATPLVEVSPEGVFRHLVAWTTALVDPRCDPRVGRCERMLSAFSPSGNTIVFVRPNVTGPDSGQVVVTLIGITGDTLYNVRLPHLMHRLTDAEFAQAATRMLGANPAANRVAALRRAGLVGDGVDAVVVAADGNVWIQPSSIGTTSKWTVLDSAGNVSAIVSMPGDLRLRAVSGDVAWGTRIVGDTGFVLVRLRVTQTAKN
jgi:hypothetical protein